MVGERQTGQVHLNIDAVQGEERGQCLVEEVALLQVGGAVVDDLGQERVRLAVVAQVGAKLDQPVQLLPIVRLLGGNLGLVEPRDRHRQHPTELRVVMLHILGSGRLDVAGVVESGRVELRGDVVHKVGVGHVGQLGTPVVGQERVKDVVGVVDEVDDVHVVLAGPGPVQPRQGLDGHHAVEPLVEVHRAEQRLVEPDLVLVGDDQHLVVGAVEGDIDLLATDVGVHLVLGDPVGGVLVVNDPVGERHERMQIAVAHVRDVLGEDAVVPDRFLPGRSHHHRFGVAIEQAGNVGSEVLDDDLHLLRDVVRVQPHPSHHRLDRLRLVDRFGVVLLPVVGNLERHLVRGVVEQYVEDVTLFDRLPH